MDKIVEALQEMRGKKIKQMPVHTLRASEIGIPCERFHVLARNHWSEKILHDVRLQAIFDMGNDIEQIVLRDMAASGLVVIEQQRAYFWDRYNISGHCDGTLVLDGKQYPFDIKSSSPFVFKSLNTISDLTNGKYSYLRKYPAQLNLYLLMGDHEKGFFLFKDKVSGAEKAIWMDIDYQLGEECLKRAEAVNAHLKAGTVPGPINDPFWCDGCAYRHICLPEEKGVEPEIDTGELAELLDEFYSLKEAKARYDELDELIKVSVVGKSKVLAGNWLVTGDWYRRKSYVVPDEIKAAYLQETEYWRRKIVKIDK